MENLEILENKGKCKNIRENLEKSGNSLKMKFKGRVWFSLKEDSLV